MKSINLVNSDIKCKSLSRSVPQGMVCHETYKDWQMAWPEDVEQDPSSNVVSKKTGEKVVSDPLSQCQNQRKILSIQKK